MKNDIRQRLFIIDGSSVMYRAFHAIPATFSTSKGLPTNAVYGFMQSLRKILNDFKPEYAVIAFDVKGPSFRHALMPGYKADRPPMPDTLSVQVPYVKRIAKAFNVPTLEMAGFEADDVIATLVKKFEAMGIKLAIITGDKDMYQLVDENTVILDYLTEKEYGPDEVKEKFGVEPQRIKDLLALSGDTSDSVPGVPGVGFKTAAKLLAEYGSVEGVFDNIESISKPKLKESLKASKDQALLSLQLVTLNMDVPIECALEEIKYSGPDYAALEPLLNELEFRKVLHEILPRAPKVEEEGLDLVAIAGKEALAGLVMETAALKTLSVTLSLTEEGFGGKLKGVAFGLNDKTARYVPVVLGGLTEDELLEALKPLIEDPGIIKHTDSSKALYLYFNKMGIEVRGIDMDTSLASYLVNPSKPDHSISALGYELLGLSPEELRGGVDIAIESRAECKKACNILKIAELLKAELQGNGLWDLYIDMELPLARVLSEMEALGIKVDREKLLLIAKEIEIELSSLEKRIYAAAGMEFNINSPKQLADLLFDRLKLKPVKKTKKGYSTDEEVLTQLASVHEAPRLIIGFRQLSKLKSTYVDALSALVNPATGRVHTSFNQTVTATGRLSSSRPNMQNIPIRGEMAGRIREAFVAEAGYSFVCADYSQIELRIVAHLSEDPLLIDAFMKDEDVHTRTASEVFGLMPGLITTEMRRRAKAINFGIIYGMGPFGLSTELGISMKEATDYINRYFDRYRLVKDFIDRTVAEAAERGYTRTVFGRRRFIPELKSPVESTVRLGNRLAINTPIQGSAADMIKAAMISISAALKDRRMRTRMLLQIHDELIFESPSEEVDDAKELVRAEMEGVVALKVPVKVNIETGPDWRSVE
ncbi:MAG TPA: DNA polymerase I [Deltaproteobacteria bacterium]|nr:MAG: DNA polymerase I [Deltaproteobacteria bacterium GWA2_55_82]OGQ63001.1 MAG: DNA polymerase I [Deltaproteobacteria bacterium RIFCSPLOWO2_02_FULL_55_12]OIJ72965.1 MAG: DNA polymerase I [Deltaproteobacteria bacterium GWC2_55_46]HBG46026.1 DNA polymerase I [Deltaproteobacteria bacterium]HCY11756.1 DNA polymerase I [Deltaproteobacteria bacterium]